MVGDTRLLKFGYHQKRERSPVTTPYFICNNPATKLCPCLTQLIIVINRSFKERYYGHNSVCELFFPLKLPFCILINTLTSLQPLMVNSLKDLISSINRFISRSLSLNPTKMYSPEGWRAMLQHSSWNSLYCSNELQDEN